MDSQGSPPQMLKPDWLRTSQEKTDKGSRQKKGMCQGLDKGLGDSEQKPLWLE